MHFPLFCVLFAIAIVTNGQEQESLFNTKVERALDLVSHLPKETITVTFENRGTKPARYYDYYVQPQHVKDVAYVGAIVCLSLNDEHNTYLFFFRSKGRTVMIKVLFQSNKKIPIKPSKRVPVFLVFYF